jgi:hypothetical protein
MISVVRTDHKSVSAHAFRQWSFVLTWDLLQKRISPLRGIFTTRLALTVTKPIWGTLNRSRRVSTMSNTVRRKSLQAVLQAGAHKFRFEQEIVCCPLCRTNYVLIQREIPPGIIPDCDACGQQFLSQENGNWLMYERIEK